MANIPELVQQTNGFTDYNPMQQLVLQAPWDSKNLVVASPTASGKTIIAELTGMNSILNKRKKAMYTCPLRALANEHYTDFQNKYSKQQNIRMAVATGDMDSSSKYLSQYDFVFTTYEKLNSLLVHRADWLQQLGTLIIDEVHELDSDRGPTLEMIITKLRILNPKLQIIALSATIPNSDELAAWLGAELIQSNYRPVPLKEGVHYESTIEFNDRSKEKTREDDPLEAMLANTLEKKKQALVFANTRPRAESLAKQSAAVVQKFLTIEDKKELAKIAQKIEHALESPTEQCKKLSALIQNGAAFHHAGLVQTQRSLIENGFRAGAIKTIAATPTLAAGVNLPSFRVIITSLHRFDFGGMVPIPIREYRQMAGRAGRPKYDSAGESIVLCKNELEASAVMEEYIRGEMEPVSSQVGREPILRMHLLGLIASRFIFDTQSMDDFFSKTLYAFQYKNTDNLFRMLRGLVKELSELGFIEGEENRFWTTKIGSRVAELYLDPLSAADLIAALKKMDLAHFGALFALVDTTEARPYLNVKAKDEALVWEELQSRWAELPITSSEAMFTDTQLVQKFQTAKFLDAWTNETPEQQLLDDFNIQPGIIRAKLQIVDWLAYSAVELAPLIGASHHTGLLSRMRKRLSSGIKEELVLLCELRGIGRVRARRMFNAGIKTVADVKATSVENLAKIIGTAVAITVKKQLGAEIEKGAKKKIEAALKEQKTLFDS